MSWTRKTVYRKLLKMYGEEHQLWKMIEEVGEFLHAFSYLKTTTMRKEKASIVERWAYETIKEMADLELMLDSAKVFIQEHTNINVKEAIRFAKQTKIKQMKDHLRERGA